MWSHLDATLPNASDSLKIRLLPTPDCCQREPNQIRSCWSPPAKDDWQQYERKKQNLSILVTVKPTFCMNLEKGSLQMPSLLPILQNDSKNPSVHQISCLSLYPTRKKYSSLNPNTMFGFKAKVLWWMVRPKQHLQHPVTQHNYTTTITLDSTQNSS